MDAAELTPESLARDLEAGSVAHLPEQLEWLAEEAGLTPEERTVLELRLCHEATWVAIAGELLPQNGRAATPKRAQKHAQNALEAIERWMSTPRAQGDGKNFARWVIQAAKGRRRTDPPTPVYDEQGRPVAAHPALVSAEDLTASRSSEGGWPALEEQFAGPDPGRWRDDAA